MIVAILKERTPIPMPVVYRKSNAAIKPKIPVNGAAGLKPGAIAALLEVELLPEPVPELLPDALDAPVTQLTLP